jgi:HSP20 family protein
MAEMRWDPFRDLRAIQERMNRLFETALSGSDFEGQDSGIGRWSPVSDVVETDGEVVVSCELPGLEKDRIDINLSGSVLIVSGERHVERETGSEQFHRIERSYGPFQRSFNLPSGVDAEKISAQYQDGVLTITLAKRPESVPRKIAVQTN